MKSDLTCYQHVPDNIAAISPAPEYMKKQFPTFKDQTHKRNNIYNAERIRTSAITKAANEQRFAAGRLHAHLKIQSMKDTIQVIKDKEQESVKTKSSLTRGIPAPDVEIDD
jgi:predicted RNA-binding protein